MGGLHVHHIGQIPKASHAAGEIFGKVTALEVRRSHDGFIGLIFRKGVVEIFLFLSPGGVEHVQEGGEGKAQSFPYGNPFPVAGFHVGSHLWGKGITEEMEFLSVFNAGHVEEAGCHMDDGIGGGQGSGGGRGHPAHLGGHEMEQGAEFSFFPQAGIADFFFDGFEIQCFVIRRQTGNEGHVGGFRNGDGRHFLHPGQQAAGLDGAPAAVHEEQALSVVEVGGDFLHHRFVVRGMGAHHEDVCAVYCFLQVIGERHVERGVDFPRTVRGDWSQQAALMRFRTYTWQGTFSD